MVRPSEGVPQTAAEAKQQGWTWLKVRCLSCKHASSISLADLIADRPRQNLAFIARRFYCGKCKSKALEFELGAYVVEFEQPWPRETPIAFEHNTTIKPRR